jgi:hypothetical protein
VLRFEARWEQNGVPAETIRDLLRATLRHRPDRIILGEIRGDEAFDLLQLLNTGYGGTISTVHANSTAQGMSRLTTCVVLIGVEIPYCVIKTHISDSLNIIIQIERRPGGRYASEVLEIAGYNPGTDRYDLHSVYLRPSTSTRVAGKLSTNTPRSVREQKTSCAVPTTQIVELQLYPEYRHSLYNCCIVGTPHFAIEERRRAQWRVLGHRYSTK